MIKVLAQAALIINILEKQGYEAYVVGGCVRDSIMGKAPNDWDIATNANPTEMLACFEGLKVIPTGIKHGTVTVLLEGEPYEVTAYRIDGEYGDNRRPKEVSFTQSIYEDIARRDFTINAMAYNQNEGLIDPFGGRDDIENRTIRAVGNPDIRFNEDALRIMRGVRLSSVLGFEVEEETEKSMVKNQDLLRNISFERIQMELEKLIAGKNSAYVLAQYRGILEITIPEIAQLVNWEERAENSAKANDLIVSLVILLFDNNITTFKNILKRLKFSGYVIESAAKLAESTVSQLEPNKISIKWQLSKYGEEIVRKLLSYKKVTDINLCLDGLKLDLLLQEILRGNECYSLDSLKINGKDLIDIGIIQGEEIGRILNIMLGKVIEEEIENNDEVLINYVKTNFKD